MKTTNIDKETRETLKAINDMKMEIAINDLKKEIKRYSNKDPFAKTFAKYFKIIEKEKLKNEIRMMKQMIKEEKKKLKNNK